MSLRLDAAGGVGYEAKPDIDGSFPMSNCMKTTMTRRQFLAAAALTSLAAATSCSSPRDGRREAARPPARFFFTSQGKTAMMNADGTGLRWFEFNQPNQVTWQPFGFLSDGHRVLFLSMEPRRDGPAWAVGLWYPRRRPARGRPAAAWRAR